MKKTFMQIICGTLTFALLSGCAAQTVTSTDTDVSVNEQSTAAASESEQSTTDEVSDNVYLDYAQAIAKGIYGWTLSEDGSYYMLSSVNEDGTPVESAAQQNFMGGGQGGM